MLRIRYFLFEVKFYDHQPVPQVRHHVPDHPQLHQDVVGQILQAERPLAQPAAFQQGKGFVASCASLHMRLSNVGRLRRHLSVKTFTPNLRMNPLWGRVAAVRRPVCAIGATRLPRFSCVKRNLLIFGLLRLRLQNVAYCGSIRRLLACKRPPFVVRKTVIRSL